MHVECVGKPLEGSEQAPLRRFVEHGGPEHFALPRTGPQSYYKLVLAAPTADFRSMVERKRRAEYYEAALVEFGKTGNFGPPRFGHGG